MQKCDFLIIGSGPAGQKAAIQGAKAGLDVVLIESERKIGGMCVHKGTIPSKALRESARKFSSAHRILNSEMPTELAPLMQNVELVVDAHDKYISAQLDRNQIKTVIGKARFLTSSEVEVNSPGGGSKTFKADNIFIATGSIPRHPPNIEIDHEYVLDSDSILSMSYLPNSLIVLGGGVIACEYASVFQSLGTQVTLLDRFDVPLGFLDEDLSGRFVSDFESKGGTFIGRKNIKRAAFDHVSEVCVELDDGTKITAEKLLVAQGRISSIAGLNIGVSGVVVTDLKLISVDENCQTSVPHIYAVGDVIGPPSLASTSMEQGRRAACHALSYPKNKMNTIIPMGIYTIPELAAVGMTEAVAREEYDDPVIGNSEFKEIARGLIAGTDDGMLKIIADPQGEKIIGVHIAGEGAAELIHLGQTAMLNGTTVQSFVEQIFNFPTLAEAYRVAALSIGGQISQQANLDSKMARKAS
ncbi:MAG: Si-specific NAD(P)(+) transhydrogenase [Pseudomonadales bacterium]|nr:Si-specific NAD(P)(+) transhydrogenase [Pseudomonadales bacterium]